MRIEEPVNINVPSGSTPLTIADAVIRECADEEWLQDVVFYINAYISRTYNTPVYEVSNVCNTEYKNR